MRTFLILILAVLLGLIGFSFTGATFAAGDSFAVFRVLMSTVALLVAILIVRGPARMVGIVMLLVLGVASPVAGYVYHSLNDRPGPYTLYQKNLLYSNTEFAAVLDEFETIDPDFITLQEVWGGLWPIWNGLTAKYDYAVKCSGPGGNSASLLSRYPIIEDSVQCRDDLGYASARITLLDGEITLVSLHLPWPYPYKQKEVLAEIIPLLQDLPGPIVLAGDFNMVPWSDTVHQVEQATNTQRAGSIKPTFIGAGGLLRLPIDQVLTPQGQGEVELRPLLGSDHRGVLLRFAL